MMIRPYAVFAREKGMDSRLRGNDMLGGVFAWFASFAVDRRLSAAVSPAGGGWATRFFRFFSFLSAKTVSVATEGWAKLGLGGFQGALETGGGRGYYGASLDGVKRPADSLSQRCHAV